MKVSETAFQLAERGFHVFPVRHDKTPYHPEGLKSASADAWKVEETFERYGDKALIAIHAGRSGLVVLDLDYKEDESGNVTVDGFTSLELAWDIEGEVIPESFAYTSVSGQGRHIMYAAPEGKNLPPKAGYRGMKGVDRRSGESYVVFTADTPPDRASLAPAPEWLCDETSVRSADRFSGDVQAWYKTLEPGEPNALVRRAIEDVEALYAKQGDDLSHSDIIEAQHRAIRLAAEGNPGCEVLLDRIEELALSRTGEHSRTPDEYLYEFQEGLVSGIEKHGAAIELRSALPTYSLAVVPKSVPDRLVTGTNGTKQDFTDLLRALLSATDDDMLVTSVLWNCPKTKDLAREWGLLFVHERITSARLKPEPVRENPTLPMPEDPTDRYRSPAGQIPDPAELDIVAQRREKKLAFLSAEEAERVKNTETFIDRYLAASKTKGFYTREYAVAAAWTALSMSFGTKAYIPKGVSIPMNIWILGLGSSGTGKSGEFSFLKSLLDVRLKDGEGYYNLGAHSSPEGLHEELLMRDNKPSMILHDEASSFFSAMKTKDWMGALEYHMSDWYMGNIEPMNKVRLKDLKGKSATTSFNIHMIGTPDRLMELIDTEMFATGFLARYNFFWAPEPVESDLQYEATLTVSEKGVNPTVFELGCDLSDAASVLDAPVMVGATEEARKRLVEAFKAFDKSAKSHERYAALEPAIKRLGRETLWKMAALTALYRGDDEILLEDALVAVHYAQDWYRDLIRVVEATSESDFSRDVNEIEAYVKSQGGSVSEAKVNHRFRSMIRRSPRELSEKLDFLRVSGRINRSEAEGRVMYTLNGQ